MTKETDFEIDENGIITGYTGSGGRVIIPAEIRGISVLTIGEGAFCESEVRCMEFPASLREIDDMAFAWNKLTEIEIPSGVEKIGKQTFAWNNIARRSV